MNETKFTPTLDPSTPSGVYIPADLDDCFRELDSMLPSGMVTELRECDEIYLPLNHFGLALWMRNNWGLWSMHSRLKRYFDVLGVDSADSASSLILTAYWHYLNGRPVDLKRLIAYDKMLRDRIASGSNASN